jgi:hypothetical protein
LAVKETGFQYSIVVVVLVEVVLVLMVLLIQFQSPF